MNRKHNPLVALVALLVLALLVGCTSDDEAKTTSERFHFEHMESNSPKAVYIITDKETGVQYIYISDSYGSGLTVLQPAPAEEEETKNAN